MSRRRRWAVAGVVTVACLGLVIGAAYGVSRVLGAVQRSLSCSADAEAADAALADADVFQLHPAAARAVQAPSWDCDADEDGPAAVYVVRSFESTGPPSEVLRYYRTALPAAGWPGVDQEGFEEGTADPFEGVTGITCFAGEVTRRKAYVSVSFALEDGRDTTSYDLVVRRADDASTGCPW